MLFDLPVIEKLYSFGLTGEVPRAQGFGTTVWPFFEGDYCVVCWFGALCGDRDKGSDDMGLIFVEDLHYISVRLAIRQFEHVFPRR